MDTLFPGVRLYNDNHGFPSFLSALGHPPQADKKACGEVFFTAGLQYDPFIPYAKVVEP